MVKERKEIALRFYVFEFPRFLSRSPSFKISARYQNMYVGTVSRFDILTLPHKTKTEALNV